MCNNGENDIIITLPTPPNGTRLFCRKMLNCTGIVNFNYSSIVYFNSIGSDTSIGNANSASYVFYNGTWYQERQS